MHNVYSGFIFCIHKLVKYPHLILCITIGGKSLNRDIPIKQRKELEAKMTRIFKENMKALSAELQKILVDDLVTAFQNRKNVLIRVQKKRSY